jgi:hypothetical protein
MTSLVDEIVAALVRHPPHTNTPLEVLAQHMVRSLDLFEHSLIERANHPFFAPGRQGQPEYLYAPRDKPIDVPPPDPRVPDLAGDQCGLYRDQLRPCADCEGD